MRYFLDTEFVEDGETIDLISIGIVSEDGREYCAVSNSFDIQKALAHPFVSVHVLPHTAKYSSVPRSQIAQDIVAFVGDEPEFWADYASYDWVALCQLYGPMVDLPKGWPYFCRDIQQFRAMLGKRGFEESGSDEHDALSDARQCKDRFLILKRIAETHKMGLAF